MGIKLKASLLSCISIIMVIGMVGTTYAKSSNNVQGNCTTNNNASLDLKIEDQDELWSDGVTATWIADNMAPGGIYDFEGSFVGLKSNDKGSIKLSCTYTVTEKPSNVGTSIYYQNSLNPDEMARELIITRCIYLNDLWQIDCLTGETEGMSAKDQKNYNKNREFLWRIPDTDEDGRITFADLKQTPLKGLPILTSNPAGETRFFLSVKFAETAGNNLQGLTFIFDMTYTLTEW